MALQSAVLISYPVGTDLGLDMSTALYRPPLGMLVVADCLRKAGVETRLVDIAVEWAAYNRRDQEEAFARTIARKALSLGHEFIGLGGIAGTMPLSVRIAQEIRKLDANVAIGFGGPGATAVAAQLLQAFPEVDFILRGEVENAIPYFVDHFNTGEFWQCPNLVFRESQSTVIARQATSGCSSEAVEGVVMNPIADIAERFPPPDYGHWGYDVGLPYLPIEVGRGCPYPCTFCSTSRFFSLNYRLVQTDDLRAYIAALLESCHPEGFEFVHDNFTVNKKKVVELCEMLKSLEHPIRWNCSSDIRHTSEALMRTMAEAGCEIIFFGIETGSPRMQKIIKKNLPLEKVIPSAEWAAKHKMIFNGSFILGYPEETREDLQATVNLIIDMLAVRESILTMSTLAPLSGTGYFRDYREQLRFDRHAAAKIAFQGAEIRRDELDLIETHRDVFPEFYSFPETCIDKATLQLICDFLISCYQIARYLLVGMRRMGYDGLDLVLEFIEHSGRDKVQRPQLEYYASVEFVEELYRFYMNKLEETGFTGERRDFFVGLAAPYVIDTAVFLDHPGNELHGPLLLPGSSIVHGTVAMSELPANFSSYEALPAACIKPVSYLQIRNGSTFKTVELSRELGLLLERCDGLASERELADFLRELGVDLDTEGEDYLFGSLRQKEFLLISPA